MLINDLQRFFASISKIIDIYYARPHIENNHNSKERPRLNGDIEFRNVTAKFGDVTVLHDINLHIRHGETIVIMGSTGSGKTTLMNLIARFTMRRRAEYMLTERTSRIMSLMYFVQTSV